MTHVVCRVSGRVGPPCVRGSQGRWGGHVKVGGPRRASAGLGGPRPLCSGPVDVTGGGARGEVLRLLVLRMGLLFQLPSLSAPTDNARKRRKI